MRSKWPLIVAVIVLVIVPLVAWQMWDNVSETRGTALAQIERQAPEELDDLATLIRTAYAEYRANAVRWSFVYFGCLFGSAFLSALAGVVLKLESFGSNEKRQRDIAAIFAASAALLITLTSIGSFEQKWRANREAADSLEALAFEVIKPDAVVRRAEILDQAQKIVAQRGNRILAGSEVTESP